MTLKNLLKTLKSTLKNHLRSKGLITDHVKHLPYEEGASLYVAKYLYNPESQYDIIESK
jgi:hypothetical protein